MFLNSIREEAGEETDCQALVDGCLGCRMPFDGQFLRQLPHRLVCFKAALAKTFSAPGSVPSSYLDQFNFGGIHLWGDKWLYF